MDRILTNEQQETALMNAIPRTPESHELGGDIYYTCHWKSCGESLSKWYNYCPKCGAKINWEGVNR